MNDSNMTGTGFPNAVPQASSNRETGKKTTRSALDFLRQCTPYEADSIRVMVGHATGKGDTDTIEATDLLAVNRFLNHGLTKENATGNEAVMRHRQERAQKLMAGTCAETDGGCQGVRQHRPAVPCQHRADEDLVRFQGRGGCAATPAIAAVQYCGQKLMSNRNRYRMRLKRTRNFPLMTFHRRGRESFRYPILISIVDYASDGGRAAGNFALLGDLLARMALTTEEAKGFRRPLMLSAGQAQYSEEQLSAQWNIGRKRIRNLLDELTRLGLIDTCRSRVASVMTFPCIRQWTAADGSTVSNPFTHTNKGEG